MKAPFKQIAFGLTLMGGMTTIVAVSQLRWAERELDKAEQIRFTVDPHPQIDAQLVKWPRTFPYFGHALIPGGAVNIEDLHEHINADRRLQAVFASFDWTHAAYCAVPHGDYFVSYLTPDGVKWTRKTHALGGELCITDGHITVLMRCGNLISWKPELPYGPSEPKDLDTPLFPPTQMEPNNKGIEHTAEFIPPIALNGSGTSNDGTIPFGGFGLPPILFPPEMGPLSPTPVSVPEPTAFTQISVGLLLTALFSWLRKR